MKLNVRDDMQKAAEKSKDIYCEFIFNKKLPVKVVKETSMVLAFYHTKPHWDIHIVIVPKEHVAYLVDVKDFSVIEEVFRVAQEIIRDMKLYTTNYRLITNGGSYQDSRHVHFHLVSGKELC